MNDFDKAQLITARELGYGDDVEALNAQHDPLHVALCAWLGVESYALREATGERLSPEHQRLAWDEEAAVLAVQKLMRGHRVPVPTPKG